MPILLQLKQDIILSLILLLAFDVYATSAEVSLSFQLSNQIAFSSLLILISFFQRTIASHSIELNASLTIRTYRTISATFS